MFFSIAIIAKPRRSGNIVEKGVIVANACDELLEIVPSVKDFFFIVERRGWFGISEERSADIRLVEDLTTLDKTRQLFPHAIALEFASGEFVDTDKFRPLGITKQYTGIQIAAWQKFKRHELFVRAAALLSDEKFIKFGHFWNKPDVPLDYEKRLRSRTMRLANKLNAHIDFPFSDIMRNDGLPLTPEAINSIINKARIGILTSEHEGINRFKMECLSADIPMLVAEDAGPSTRRHINEKTGILFKPTPENLAEAIRYVIKHRADFSPRRYILENTGIHNALPMLKDALRKLARRDGSERQYEEIYYNGRNENMMWEKSRGIAEVKKAMQEVPYIIQKNYSLNSVSYLNN